MPLLQLDAKTRAVISQDAGDCSIGFQVIGQDKGTYKDMEINRTIGSTISFR